MIFTNLHELIPSGKCKEFHSLSDHSPFQFKIKVTLDVVNTRTKQLRKRNNSFSKYDCNNKKKDYFMIVVLFAFRRYQVYSNSDEVQIASTGCHFFL